MPPSVRVAIIVMSVLAGLLLLNTALSLYVYDEIVGRVTDIQGLSQSDAERTVVLWLAPNFVFGLIFALAAWFVPRRHAWARWLGLAVASMLAVFLLMTATRTDVGIGPGSSVDAARSPGAGEVGTVPA